MDIERVIDSSAPTYSALSEGRFYTEFSCYATKYVKHNWDLSFNDPRDEFRNKNDLVTNFYRYYKVISLIRSLWREPGKVVDFGIYPGVLPKVFKEFYPVKGYEYCGVGLGFNSEFCREMNALGVLLHETELDPNYFDLKEVRPVPFRDADVVLFLDIIEHLANPIYALDEANKTLKPGGQLILTTDNICCLNNIMKMLNGETPLPHPLQTSMFYNGDWRPHVREFARSELCWLLEHSGFSVMKHEYFDRKQGAYYVSCNSKVHSLNIKRHIPRVSCSTNPLRVFRSISSAIVRMALSRVSRFMNHQIVVAQKRIDVAGLIGKRPEMTGSTQEWLEIRKKYLKE